MKNGKCNIINFNYSTRMAMIISYAKDQNCYIEIAHDLVRHNIDDTKSSNRMFIYDSTSDNAYINLNKLALGTQLFDDPCHM